MVDGQAGRLTGRDDEAAEMSRNSLRIACTVEHSTISRHTHSFLSHRLAGRRAGGRAGRQTDRQAGRQSGRQAGR